MFVKKNQWCPPSIVMLFGFLDQCHVEEMNSTDYIYLFIHNRLPLFFYCFSILHQNLVNLFDSCYMPSPVGNMKSRFCYQIAIFVYVRYLDFSGKRSLGQTIFTKQLILLKFFK